MNSLKRMMAAVRGEPLDRYPVMNPYPFFSMQPHWPELTGLTFAHVYNYPHVCPTTHVPEFRRTIWIKKRYVQHGSEKFTHRRHRHREATGPRLQQIPVR